MTKFPYSYLSLRLGPLSTNCYLVWDSGGEAAVIDTAGKAEQIWSEVQKRNLKLRYIVNTHGHFDHISCNSDLANLSGAKIAIHEADAKALIDDSLSLASKFQPNYSGRAADRLLSDGEQIVVGEMQFSVIHTPGHTPGGICLICENLLFSGDTIFARSIGRCDLIGGDEAQLMRSLKYKLWPLSEDYTVLPGHGSATSLNAEKEHNLWMRRAAEL